MQSAEKQQSKPEVEKTNPAHAQAVSEESKLQVHQLVLGLKLNYQRSEMSARTDLCGCLGGARHSQKLWMVSSGHPF